MCVTAKHLLIAYVPEVIIPLYHYLTFLPHPVFLFSDVSKPPAHSCRHLPDNIEYRSHTYKVVSGNMSWYDAMHMCTENDSDLVSVTDAYHQAFLTVLVNRLAVPHWIGLYSQDVCILPCNMYNSALCMSTICLCLKGVCLSAFLGNLTIYCL